MHTCHIQAAWLTRSSFELFVADLACKTISLHLADCWPSKYTYIYICWPLTFIYLYFDFLVLWIFEVFGMFGYLVMDFLFGEFWEFGFFGIECL